MGLLNPRAIYRPNMVCVFQSLSWQIYCVGALECSSCLECTCSPVLVYEIQASSRKELKHIAGTPLPYHAPITLNDAVFESRITGEVQKLFRRVASQTFGCLPVPSHASSVCFTGRFAVLPMPKRKPSTTPCSTLFQMHACHCTFLDNRVELAVNCRSLRSSSPYPTLLPTLTSFRIHNPPPCRSSRETTRRPRVCTRTRLTSGRRRWARMIPKWLLGSAAWQSC